MQGFFSKEVEQSILMPDCKTCGLYKCCKSPKMKCSGEGQKQILIIGEAPGSKEDEVGRQFIGSSGILFNQIANKYGIDIHKDCWLINSVNCRPTDYNNSNRPPTNNEIICCRPMVQRTIAQLKPKFIWLVGDKALKSFYQGKYDYDEISIWRKRCIPDLETNAWIVCLYHPAFALRNPSGQLLFAEDVKYAISCLGKKQFPNMVPLLGDKINIAYNYQEAMEMINLLDKERTETTPTVIDYETNYLKPYHEDAKIYCVSVAIPETTIVFPIDHPNINYNVREHTSVKDWVNRLLRTSKGLIAHHIAFEDMWSRKYFDIGVNKDISWLADTMLNNHIISGGVGGNSLKFLAYVMLGVHGYEDKVKPYMRSDSKEMNNLHKFPLHDLLFYCGMDSLVTRKIYEIQNNLIQRNENLKAAVKLFTEGIKTLTIMSAKGVLTNQLYYKNINEWLSEEAVNLFKELLTSPEAELFKNTYGREISLTSPDDLKLLFYKAMKIPCPKLTGKGNESVDEGVLESLHLPFADKLLTGRKLNKAKSTYLEPMTKNTDEFNYLHPFFNLHTVHTFRSCVAKGSLITILVNDTEFQIPIEEIRIGDYVKCLDDESKITYDKVEWAGFTGCRKTIRLFYTIFNGNKYTLDITPEHKIRLAEGWYREAENLISMAHYSLANNTKLNAILSYDNPNTYKEVYDIKTEKYHNFFANNLCVHNSSSEPNMQNQPRRNDYIRSLVRSGIIPSLGNQLFCADYGGLEVRIMACYSQDPTLVSYLWDGYDFHQEWAKKIYKVTDEEIVTLKSMGFDLRYFAKNMWVFPLFYGSWHGACHVDLWREVTGRLREYLLDTNKFRDDGHSFPAHCEYMEREFWNTFPGVKQYHERNVKFYEQNGYVQLLTGFKCGGLLSKNQIINFPIQGTGFHLMLWSSNQLREDQKIWESKMNCEIHDELIFDLFPPEFEVVSSTVERVMTKDITKQYSWINVPMTVECAITPINGSWNDKKKVELTLK